MKKRAACIYKTKDFGDDDGDDDDGGDDADDADDELVLWCW
jgi:hypothetical protein